MAGRELMCNKTTGYGRAIVLYSDSEVLIIKKVSMSTHVQSSLLIVHLKHSFHEASIKFSSSEKLHVHPV